jgi:hypothetical protein
VHPRRLLRWTSEERSKRLWLPYYGNWRPTRRLVPPPTLTALWLRKATICGRPSTRRRYWRKAAVKHHRKLWDRATHGPGPSFQELYPYEYAEQLEQEYDPMAMTSDEDEAAWESAAESSYVGTLEENRDA